MFEQLHSGELYDPNDADIMEIQLPCLDRLREYNATRACEQERRTALLR